MNKAIDQRQAWPKLRQWLNARPKMKQWLWFIALWLGGLLTVSALAYPIKWLMKGM